MGEKYQPRDKLIFVEKFKTIGRTLYGKAKNQKWYVICNVEYLFMNPLGSTETQFKEVSEAKKLSDIEEQE